MFNLRHMWKLRKAQRARTKIERERNKVLKGTTGDKRQSLLDEWRNEFSMVQEEIDELLSDRIRKQAERYDVALPKREEGDYWERLYHIGEKLILTTLGREITREKIMKEKKNAREGRAFVLSVLSLLVAFGGVSVAALALYLRK